MLSYLMCEKRWLEGAKPRGTHSYFAFDTAVNSSLSFTENGTAVSPDSPVDTFKIHMLQTPICCIHTCLVHT